MCVCECVCHEKATRHTGQPRSHTTHGIRPRSDGSNVGDFQELAVTRRLRVRYGVERGLERGVTSSCRQAIKMVKFARGLRGEYALSVRGWRSVSVWVLILAPILSYALPALVARLVAYGAADGAHTRVVLMV